MSLPAYMKKYFWDCDFESLDWERYRKFITERILNLGNDDALDWVTENVDREFLVELVKTSRQLDAKTRNFWELILELRPAS